MPGSLNEVFLRGYVTGQWEAGQDVTTRKAERADCWVTGRGEVFKSNLKHCSAPVGISKFTRLFKATWTFSHE